MSKKKKKKIRTKVDVVKTKGKGLLNLKAPVFADKRTKRKKTRQTKIDEAIKNSKG